MTVNLPIKYKLFFLLFGLTAGVGTIIFVATNRIVSQEVREGVVDNFSRTQTFLNQQQRLRYDRLVESAYLIAENSTFIANLSLDDPPTMEQSVRQFSRFVKADLMIVTNQDGRVLSWRDAPEKQNTDLRSQPNIRKALSGDEPPPDIQLPNLWAIGERLFQTVTIPVYGGDDVIGTLTLGSRFTEVEAANLRQDSTMHVTMVLNETPIASTRRDGGSALHDALRTTVRDSIEAVLRERRPTAPFRLDVDGREHFAFLSPLGRGEPAFYVASVPVSIELATLYSLRENIFLIAIIAALLTIPLAIVLGGIVSRPIERLKQAMGRVEEGDLNVEVPVTSRDEIGQLARNFNQMIADLRERSLLQRHVGNHTLEMIRASDNLDEAPNGKGQIRELAILFTDIRGSTDQIERTNPHNFVRHLNRTLSTQARAATYFEGSIDKFIGDAMIALFDEDDALEKALRCSIAIQRGFQKDPLCSSFFDGLGVGVNYGPMLMGNMGGEERLDYSVIGTEVNLCARLCSAAGPGQILVPKGLVERHYLADTFRLESVDVQSFKGFDRQFEIAEVIYATDTG